MRVLVACEFSGIVRDAFITRGHEAMSCDFLPTESEGPHYQGDVFDVIDDGWDLMIAFPPCTYLARCSARWMAGRLDAMLEAYEFVRRLIWAPVPRIAIENPPGVLSNWLRKPDQIIQPWQFGHGETKMTCLWLVGLPLLEPTDVVDGREPRVWKLAPGPDRAKDRSRFYPGIADGMADQWGETNCPIDKPADGSMLGLSG